MSTKNTKFKKVIKLLYKIGVTCAYVCLIAVLVTQALTPGGKSSDISNNVGDKIDEIVTEIQKPETPVVNVESVAITSLTASGITYTGEEIALSLGSVAKVKCEVIPANATNPALEYSSSNSEIIKAYSDGKVEAVAIGNAILTVSSVEKPDLKASVFITVKNVPIESFSVGNVPSELQVGQSRRLEITYKPVNTSEKALTWKSSDTAVLTVNSSGIIKGIKEGQATVTVISKVNPELTHSVTVTVIPKVVVPEEPEIVAESVTILADNQIGRIGYTKQLSATIAPKGVKDSVIWSSSNEDIATVSQSGLVTFLKAGEVTIIAKCSKYDKEDTVTLTVKEVLSSTITLETENLIADGDNFALKQGNSGKVIAHLSEDATILTVTYSSSDPTIANVNADGVIEALKGGTVTITATSSYDGEEVSQSITLTVNKITFSDNVQNFYYKIRKSVGHFGAFLVLGIFAALTYLAFTAKNTKGKIISFVICIVAGFAVAGITEILQLPIFTEGRHCSFKDVMLDFKGYCASSLIIYFFVFAVHFLKPLVAKIKAKKNQEN